MPFRERVKRAFSRSSSSESPAPTEPPAPAPIFRTTTSGTVYEIYAPGECPPSKYKGAWDHGHQEKLKNFTFQWDPLRRRRSRQSLYSPGGTRMPSRNPSRNVSRGPSRAPSCAGSVRSAKRRILGVGSGNTAAAPSIHVDDLKESVDDDGDVSNVGLSRQVSPDTSRPSLQLSRQTSPIHRRRGSVSSYHHPLARQISPISMRGPSTSEGASVRRPRSHSRPQDPDLPVDVQILNIAATTIIPEADTPGISPERATEPIMINNVKASTNDEQRTELSNNNTETQRPSNQEETERHLTPASMRSTASSVKSNISSHHRRDSVSTATAMSQHPSLSLGTSASFIQNYNSSSKQTLPINIPVPHSTTTASKHSPTATNGDKQPNSLASTMPKSSPEYDTPFHPDELARALTESTSGTNLVGMNGVVRKARESFGRKTSRASNLSGANGDAINKRRSFISLMRGQA